MIDVVIYTIGHGNRAIAEFLSLLEENGIACVVDVRAYPGSRRHPQFGSDPLERSLALAGIRYVWEGRTLGGRRRSNRSSPHLALKSKSFRAYADHMMTVPFREGLERLVEAGSDVRTVILCAERLPWECHRNLIADSLVARGVGVMHLIGPGQVRAHELSRLARRDGDRLIYDAGEQLALGLTPSTD